MVKWMIDERELGVMRMPRMWAREFTLAGEGMLLVEGAVGGLWQLLVGWGCCGGCRLDGNTGQRCGEYVEMMQRMGLLAQ